MSGSRVLVFLNILCRVVLKWNGFTEREDVKKMLGLESGADVCDVFEQIVYKLARAFLAVI